MPNSQLHTAISTQRFQRYLAACGNRERALFLYRANIALSQQLFGILAVFEVVLRNSIDRYMISRQGEYWLENAVLNGGYFDINAGCEDIYHSVQEAIHKLGKQYTHDRLITRLTLGFWTYLFAPKEFAAAGSLLLGVFPKRPFGINQKVVFQNLIKINELRNRIAHHEPICFEKDAISTNRTERRYRLILELLDWLGCNSHEILSEIDQVAHPLGIINEIRFPSALRE
jgi:hypothetical protein